MVDHYVAASTVNFTRVLFSDMIVKLNYYFLYTYSQTWTLRILNMVILLPGWVLAVNIQQIVRIIYINANFVVLVSVLYMLNRIFCMLVLSVHDKHAVSQWTLGRVVMDP